MDHVTTNMKFFAFSGSEKFNVYECVHVIVVTEYSHVSIYTTA